MLANEPPTRGAIVNTSSNAGLRAVTMLSAYAASKHGILGLTKNAAVEYADDGIRVNAVCPGAIMTPLMSDQPPDRQQEILAPQAMTRFGDPAEVAAAVVWLCSDEASFVTGVALPVDAGSVAWVTDGRRHLATYGDAPSAPRAARDVVWACRRRRFTDGRMQNRRRRF